MGGEVDGIGSHFETLPIKLIDMETVNFDICSCLVEKGMIQFTK